MPIVTTRSPRTLVVKFDATEVASSVDDARTAFEISTEEALTDND